MTAAAGFGKLYGAANEALTAIKTDRPDVHEYVNRVLALME